MADTYTTSQKITTIQAGVTGNTTVQPSVQQTINFGKPILENVQSITSNYCITTGSGAFSAGPITISAIVRVPDGSSWVIK